METFGSNWGVKVICNLLDGYLRLHKVIGEKKTLEALVKEIQTCTGSGDLEGTWYYSGLYTFTSNSKSICCYQIK